MQWLSYTMSSTEKRRALPHGLVRFHSFWSELRDFWDSSLLRDTHTFQQELLKKYLDKKKGGWWEEEKKIHMFWSALNSGHCFTAIHFLRVWQALFCQRKKSPVQHESIEWSTQPQCTWIHLISKTSPSIFSCCPLKGLNMSLTVSVYDSLHPMLGDL